MEEEDKRRIKFLLPNLVNEVSPSEILPYLTCLSDMARQQIVNCEKRESSHEAMMTLYQHLIRRKKGFAELEVALRTTDKEELADILIGQTEHHFDETSGSTRNSPPKKPKRKVETTTDQRKKTEIGHDTYVRDLNVCAFKILDQLDYSGQENWESLAGHLGLSFRECQRIKHDANSGHGEGCTRILLDQFIEITLGELLCILRNKMHRKDIVNQMEDFTSYNLPNDEMARKPDENTQPTLQIQGENKNTSFNKRHVIDKDISKIISGKAQTNGGITEADNYKNINLPRILQKSHAEKSALEDYPVQMNCRDEDCMLQHQAEIDGLETSCEIPQPFSCNDNNEIPSVERVRFYAREEASMATDGCDANDLKEYNAQHPRTNQLCRQESNSPGLFEPVLSGSPLHCSDLKPFSMKSNGKTPESRHNNDEMTIISYGDPRSVHHYDRPETGMLSIETLLFDRFGDKLDLQSILSSNEEVTDKQKQDFKMIQETNEERPEHAITTEPEENNIGGDTDDERNLDYQLSDAPKAGNDQLPNWDMLHSENTTLVSADYEGSTASSDNSNGSSDLSFLKEIEPNTVKVRTIETNSIDDSSVPLSTIGGDDKLTQSDSTQNRMRVLHTRNYMFNTCEHGDKEYKFASQNNNLEFVKDNHANCDLKNNETASRDKLCGEKKRQIDGDKEGLIVAVDCMSSNDEEQKSGPMRLVRNSLFVAGGAMLATLAYRSLKS